MTKARRPGDPWYTLLYRDPYRHWWAPAVFIFVLLIGFFGVAGEEWPTALLFAAISSGLYLLFSGLRHRARTHP